MKKETVEIEFKWTVLACKGPLLSIFHTIFIRIKVCFARVMNMFLLPMAACLHNSHIHTHTHTIQHDTKLSFAIIPLIKTNWTRKKQTLPNTNPFTHDKWIDEHKLDYWPSKITLKHMQTKPQQQKNLPNPIQSKTQCNNNKSKQSLINEFLGHLSNNLVNEYIRTHANYISTVLHYPNHK